MNSLGLGLGLGLGLAAIAAITAGGLMTHQNLSVIGVPFYRNAAIGAFWVQESRFRYVRV
jgi:hypothetical protein